MSDTATATACFVLGNVVNLYSEPSTSSETVSQAVMGARVQSLAQNNGFHEVQTEDRYRGWVREILLAPCWDQSDHLLTSVATLFADVFSAPEPQSELLTKLVAGTQVCVAHRPEVDEFVPVLLVNHEIGYIHRVCLNMTYAPTEEQTGPTGPAQLQMLDLKALKQYALQAAGRQSVSTAQRFIGTPYLWGGTTSFGLDCSGFVQLAYKLSGVQLLRDAHQQYTDRRFYRIDAGQALDQGEWMPGDLVVFSRRDDHRPTHIGMTLADGRFIHALGGRGVCISSCTEPQFAEQFVGAVRLSPDANLSIDAAQ